jgi:hypothetical protein
MPRLACAVVLASFAVACSPYRVTPIRSGALYTSKGDRCGIRFENINFQEGISRYEGIGMVTVSGASGTDFTDAMKADVENAACHMGGDAVSLNASPPGAFQFLVWRSK